MSLGRTLKALRQKQSLNQKALSALSGVSQATISRIETGRVRQLRSSALKNLADALGVSVDFLMGDNEIFAHIPSANMGGSIPGVPGVREDRFRQIADTLDAFVIHENGRVLYVNQTLADLLGYRKEELLGKNGIELILAPQSRSVTQRMIASRSSETYEVLMVRCDGSTFPVEITGRNISENVRLAVTRDITGRRCQQAVSRVQRAGLEIEKAHDLGKVVRILGDELEDMGLQFEAVGLQVIDDEKNLLTSYHAYPEARGYRSFQDVADLQESLERFAPLRGLVSHWHRNKVWEREADERFLQMTQSGPLGATYHPEMLIDVPFSQGMLGLGLSSGNAMRTEHIVSMLNELSQPISFIIKRLFEIQLLREELESTRNQLLVKQRD
ncbi:MAG: PAS domain S-box protein [Gemmatimonadetes bacterium]|jgi:PAS domain S-box-containing protein|nr:PAS domain S-box protein [Gemmatimonadota bacterium]MBT5327500.1 PAS domain S-box protein [Gemmatimonadota bacterium]MBT5450389.1 PAS domain S-box protein [Gemmatimonadota bacterium]MBT5801056.1 PAS domain S-box protein [Gemmatimonadota bacterium]MBT6621673.1 PAS domain S-box protein [Gemmatimonadota bacterium]